MLMPASSEFVALCQAQVALLTQALGATLSVVYLTEEFVEGQEAKLIPVVAFPEQTVLWQEKDSLALLPDAIERLNNVPRLLSAAPQDSLTPQKSDVGGGDREGRRGRNGHTLVQQRQIVLPLIHEGVVMGLLVTNRKDRPWNEQEKMEIERIAHTMAIACILDQRSQWLSQQFSQQQRLQTQQNDLLHNLLHQLRNPLTALRTFGKLLLKRLQLEDANRDIASNILRESDRIQELLQQFDGVVDMTVNHRVSLPAFPELVSVDSKTAVESVTEPPSENKPLLLLPETGLMGVESLAPCSVTQVLEPLITSAMAIAQERNLKLKADIPSNLPLVRANAKALREVFSNLIDNALKYTPSEGIIYIQAGLERQFPHGRWQGVGVSDTGPGIPPQDLERLFERHYRGVQANTSIPGTGLGLAIARDLVRQMQGEIEVFSPSIHSADGVVGATFIVWLPES